MVTEQRGRNQEQNKRAVENLHYLIWSWRLYLAISFLFSSWLIMVFCCCLHLDFCFLNFLIPPGLFLVSLFYPIYCLNSFSLSFVYSLLGKVFNKNRYFCLSPQPILIFIQHILHTTYPNFQFYIIFLFKKVKVLLCQPQLYKCLLNSHSRFHLTVPSCQAWRTLAHGRPVKSVVSHWYIKWTDIYAFQQLSIFF